MSLERAIKADLDNNVGVGRRVYPSVIPEGAQLPAITYQRVSTMRHHCMGGDAALQRPRMRIDCWGKTYGDAKTVADAVVARYQNKSGTLGAGSNTVSKVAVLTADESDAYDEDARRYGVRLDFFVFHEV